jgi:co-chaperonin GroES (HSP10)
MSMKKGNKELFVVGDRVLVRPVKEPSRTPAGLLLPPGVREKEDVRGGIVVAKGPGTPLPPPQGDGDESWKTAYQSSPRYLPMQVEAGDYVLFFRKAAIEIEFEAETFLVVPHAAILILVRGDSVPDELPEEL